jgi:uncharacterized protein (DUF2236 family)
MNARIALPRLLPMPSPLRRRIDEAAQDWLQPPNGARVDFSRPLDAPALVPPDSVSWQMFKNPIALFIGGVAAVILELAEPAVRTGVWEHSSFRTDPVLRLRRTGLAAMVTVYGPRGRAEAMIADVVRRHAKVAGKTPSGESYHANDVRLLSWVHGTASFGFAEAYSLYVRALAPEEMDRVYAEGEPAARLYGAFQAPRSRAEMQALFDAMRERLEPSPILFEFFAIMRAAPAFPAPLRPLQPILVRAAVELTPGWVRERLGLTARHGLRAWERPVVHLAARLADRVMLRSCPAVQSCLRLGLPADYLFRR